MMIDCPYCNNETKKRGRRNLLEELDMRRAIMVDALDDAQALLLWLRVEKLGPYDPGHAYDERLKAALRVAEELVRRLKMEE